MDTILNLAKNFEDVKLKAGEKLITEGEQRDELFILMEGSVEVLKSGVSICEADSVGTVFGEIAALLGLPHMASVQARTDSTFKIVRNARPFLSKHPDVFREIAEVLAWRLVSTSNHLSLYQEEFSKISQYACVETNERATALKHFRTYWKESWNLFERQHYQSAGLEVESLEFVQFVPDEVILQQCANDGRVYILRTGSVEVVKNDVPLFMVWDKGVIFGEISALLGTGHSATVRTLEPCTMQVVESVETLFSAHQDIAWFISALLAKRLLDVNKYFVGLKLNFNRFEKQFGDMDKQLLTTCMANCEKGLHRSNIAKPVQEK